MILSGSATGQLYFLRWWAPSNWRKRTFGHISKTKGGCCLSSADRYNVMVRADMTQLCDIFPLHPLHRVVWTAGQTRTSSRLPCSRVYERIKAGKMDVSQLVTGGHIYCQHSNLIGEKLRRNFDEVNGDGECEKGLCLMARSRNEVFKRGCIEV